MIILMLKRCNYALIRKEVWNFPNLDTYRDMSCLLQNLYKEDTIILKNFN